ncbi:hypothetical protein RKD30_005099 [Streptomyces pristinaespiralis]
MAYETVRAASYTWRSRASAVEEAELSRDLVLFLEGEPVGGPSGGEVQRVADVEEDTARFRQPFTGGVGEP